MSAKLQHALLLGTALVAAAGSAVWFGRQEAKAARIRHKATHAAAPPPAAPRVPVGREAPAGKTGGWQPPSAQSRGREWIYDLFTPPEIRYDERTKQFGVLPPAGEPRGRADAGSPPAAFGLELLGVKRAPFRLQLVGYAGGEGTYGGLFENALTTGVFLARAGRQVPALNLAIETFGVRRVPVNPPGSMTTHRLVAIAVVRDTRTGETVTLTSAERACPGPPVATVMLTRTAEPRDVHEGDQVEVDGAVFRIGRVQFAPPALDVTKVRADRFTEERTLTGPTPDPPVATPPDA